MWFYLGHWVSCKEMGISLDWVIFSVPCHKSKRTSFIFISFHLHFPWQFVTDPVIQQIPWSWQTAAEWDIKNTHFVNMWTDFPLLWLSWSAAFMTRLWMPIPRRSFMSKLLRPFGHEIGKLRQLCYVSSMRNHSDYATITCNTPWEKWSQTGPIVGKFRESSLNLI